jgi:hypothetical protein
MAKTKASFRSENTRRMAFSSWTASRRSFLTPYAPRIDHGGWPTTAYTSFFGKYGRTQAHGEWDGT